MLSDEEMQELQELHQLHAKAYALKMKMEKSKQQLSELKIDFDEEAKKEENSKEKGLPIRSAVEDVYAENGLNQAAYFAN